MSVKVKPLALGLGLAAGIGIMVATRKASAAINPKGGPKAARKKGVVVKRPEDYESLARLIASEAGGEPKLIQTAVAWATRNEAKRRGVSVTALLTYPDGKYGAQSEGRYASTRLAPNAAHRALAKAVMDDKAANPTQGATQYDSPQAQRKLLAKKAKGYKKTPEQVAATRRQAGKRLVLLPGIPEERFRMWA